MKKRMIFLVAAVMITASIFAGSNSFAESVQLDEKWNVGVTSSVFIPTESALETGFNVEAMVSYDIMDYVAIGAEAGYTTFDIKMAGIDWGTANSLPILGDIILKYPMEFGNNVLVPYMTNGFGVLITDFDKASNVTSANTDTGFLYKIAMGIDYYFTDIIGINFEASYQYAAIDWDFRYADSTKIGILTGTKVDGLYLGGGIKIKF